MLDNLNKKYALEIENLNFKYHEKSKELTLKTDGIKILENTVNLFMGASGCGKSTLATIIAGLYPENAGVITQGDIKVFGISPSSMPVNERVGCVTIMFQNPNLQFCMSTLREEMIFTLENIMTPSDIINEKIEEFASIFDISKLLDRKFITLSGGEKQKAILCCLLLIEPKMLILDEPFANMDEKSAVFALEILDKYIAKKNITIIAIDHKFEFWIDRIDQIFLFTTKAQLVKSQINKENLFENLDYFKKEGIFLPEKYTRQVNYNSKLIAQNHKSKGNLIELKNFSIEIENQLLFEADNICFKKGCMTAIVGKSGSGKSTFLKSLLKVVKYNGSLKFNKSEIKNCKSNFIYSKIAIVFQNPSNQFITTEVSSEIEQSIKIWNKNIDSSEISDLAFNELKRINLEKYTTYSPFSLSQGQQRRLAVLSVIVGNQELLLLDEPTYGQDYRTTCAIMTKLQDLVVGKNISIIFTTHDKHIVKEYADDVIIIENKSMTYRNKYEK